MQPINLLTSLFERDTSIRRMQIQDADFTPLLPESVEGDLKGLAEVLRFVTPRRGWEDFCINRRVSEVELGEALERDRDCQRRSELEGEAYLFSGTLAIGSDKPVSCVLP